MLYNLLAEANVTSDHAHEILVTFAEALFFGVFLVLIAHRIKVSMIVILLIGGVILGPECLGWIDPNHLGDGLSTIVALSVAIILFEGGLNLDYKGYRSVSKEIKGILTIGV